MAVASSWYDYFFRLAAFFAGFFAAAFFFAMRTPPPFVVKVLMNVCGISEFARRVKYLSSSGPVKESENCTGTLFFS